MKKRKKLIILGIVTVAVAIGIYFVLNGSGANPNASQAVLSKGADNTNVLVVYFSRANEIEITDSIDAVSSASLNQEDGETIEDLVSDADVYTSGWSRAGDSVRAEETKKDAVAWAESVLSELGQ